MFKRILIMLCALISCGAMADSMCTDISGRSFDTEIQFSESDQKVNGPIVYKIRSSFKSSFSQDSKKNEYNAYGTRDFNDPDTFYPHTIFDKKYCCESLRTLDHSETTILIDQYITQDIKFDYDELDYENLKCYKSSASESSSN